MSVSSVRGRLVQLLEPLVRDAGYDLEDVAVTSAGRRRLVRVVVDRDGGVDLDDVAELSRAASDALDAADVMGAAAYQLEVTSPGVDRPLTEPRHWRRAVGRLVTVTLRDGGSVTGRLTSAEDGDLVVDTAGGSRTLSLDEVVRGAVQVEFTRPDAAADEEELPA